MPWSTNSTKISKIFKAKTISLSSHSLLHSSLNAWINNDLNLDEWLQSTAYRLHLTLNEILAEHTGSDRNHLDLYLRTSIVAAHLNQSTLLCIHSTCIHIFFSTKYFQVSTSGRQWGKISCRTPEKKNKS